MGSVGRKERKDNKKEIKREEIKKVIRKLKERPLEKMEFQTRCGNMKKKRNSYKIYVCNRTWKEER